MKKAKNDLILDYSETNKIMETEIGHVLITLDNRKKDTRLLTKMKNKVKIK